MADMFTPRALLLAIHESGIRKDNFFLRMFFHETYTFTTKKVDLDNIPNKPKIAPFCAPYIGGIVDKNQGYSTTSFEPAYVKSKHAVSAENTVKRLAGEGLGGTKSAGERLNAIVMQNIASEEEAIAMREEWMAAQMVLNGEYMVDGPNIETPYQISAGRRVENNIVLIGDERWSQLDFDTHDVISDIEEYAALSDSETNIMVLDPKAWSFLRKFKKFRDALETRRGSSSEIETTLKDLGKAVSYKGHLGDVNIWVVNEEYTDRDGSTKKQMPDNTMILGHTSARGLRLYGAIQDLDAVEQGLNEAERYAKDWKEGSDPAVRYTKIESAPAPYLADANSFVVLKVN
ncbi:major capsid protein [Shewanella surugensis]|uniref:Major capsid protein n=1 Tax=Shewanella surugensis TaxID=212020 RepID=A0ABT0L9J7_9GAMM|nr:major capsid protein [Shewanella surugensis]MCL1124155.1 major capsid protein [Shewanella surugensis]